MRISEPGQISQISQIGQISQIRKPIPLTPLVDIVFLLLMFFMLSSTFTKFSRLDMATAAGNATAQGGNAFPGIIIVVNAHGRLTVNGSPVTQAQLSVRLDEHEAQGAKQAALRAGPDATVQDLVSALEAAKRSRLTGITVVE
jgi:biopolymer transport protein ExbD